MTYAISNEEMAHVMTSDQHSTPNTPPDSTPSTTPADSSETTTTSTGLRNCCQTWPGSEHYRQCPKWVPELTVEEIAHLRATVLRGVVSD